jgi:hypothetical protein
MQCSERDQLFNRYLDGELSSDEASSLQAHLAECDVCCSAWEAMRWVSSSLESEPMASPAPGFSARVTARIEARALRQRRLYSIVGLSVAAVGLWMLALFAILSVGSAAWPALVRSSLLAATLHVLRGTFDLVCVLAGALRSLWAVAYAQSNVTIVLGYVALASLVVASWVEIVLRRRMPVWLRIWSGGRYA